MSLLDLKVELATHQISFHIQVSPSHTIRQVKEQLHVACPGAPRVDGQRIIWRGRVLNDEERVQDIIKSPTDSPVIHLAVHPSGWTTLPVGSENEPSSTPESDTPRPEPSAHRPAPAATPTATSAFRPIPGLPLPVVTHHHTVALHTLMHGRPPPNDTDMSGYPQAHSFAKSVLRAHGMVWPAVLDEEYPPVDESAEGVKYERVVIDNSPFLSLTTPDAIPSPCQAHALNVLRTTYALLSIPTPELSIHPSSGYHSSTQGTPNTNLNHHLQQVGLPALRLAPNQNPNRNPADPNNPLVPEIRAIPLRALMVPLMMLTFRTLLLMYFFSPSKRPLFGVVLSAWILYEAWNAFRMVLGNGNRPGPDRDGAAAGAGAGAAAGDNIHADAAADAGLGGAAPQPGAQAPAAGVGGQGTDRNSSRSWTNALLDKLANFQLVTEELALVGDPTNAVPHPTPFHRIKTFWFLCITTLHPAVWDRRRAYIRRREGRLRGEATMRTTAPDEEDQSPAAVARRNLREHLVTRHERRPAWVKDYIERVLTTEWTDDS